MPSANENGNLTGPSTLGVNPLRSSDSPLGLCPEHPTTQAWRTCARCGRFLCAKCTHPTSTGSHCPACILKVAPTGRPLAGLLILPLFTLAAYPVWILFDLVASVESLAGQDLSPAPGNFEWYLIAVVSVGQGCLALFTLNSYLRRRRIVPKLMQIFFAIKLALVALDLVFGTIAPPSPSVIVLSLAFPVIWIAYFRFSIRVRNTFVR